MKPSTLDNEILELNEANFKQFAIDDPSPILIDFWAPWCGPCQMMKPVLSKAATALAGRVRVAKVNVDENPGLAQAFGIQGFPTCVVLKDRNIVSSVSGVVPADKLVATVKSKLGLMEDNV